MSSDCEVFFYNGEVKGCCANTEQHIHDPMVVNTSRPNAKHASQPDSACHLSLISAVSSFFS